MSEPQDAELNPSDQRPDRSARELPPDLKSFEATLSGLVPRDDRLDRERLAFLAGQASMAETRSSIGNRQRHPAWPVAFAGMTAVAAVLFVAVFRRPVVENVLPAADEIASNRFYESHRAAMIASSQAASDVLAARDAISGDIERKLAALVKDDSGKPLSIERRDAAPLTPASLRRVFDDTTPTIPSRDSSSRPLPRRTEA